jgi:CheY-like chemotaxis protein
MRILAVDDDPVILELLAEVFETKEGYHLDGYLSAESGLEALNTAIHPFDCILLDIMLPGMNGIEMCQMLRKVKRHSSTPVVMITGSNEVNLMARAFAAGATDFITKPLAKLDLTARVNSAGLLNQSLAKAQHTMSELAQLSKIRFEEPIGLNVEGMSDFLALENEFLRYKAGSFAMTMFAIDICSMRGIYRSVSMPTYRRALETIGASAVETMKGHKSKLTYVGNGRFVSAIMERSRVNRDALTESFNADLVNVWDPEKTGIPVAPTILIPSISTQRIWSGISASDALRTYMAKSGGMSNVEPFEENNLFSRLEHHLAKSK